MGKKSSSRIRRATTSSIMLGLVAAVLATVNSYMQTRDRQIALGPAGAEQQRFFDDAVSRPDISAFYKKLRPAEKIRAAENLTRYADPKMVALAAIWLSDFDPFARNELSKSIKTLASKTPEGVIAELKNNGGFQKITVAEALRSLGASVLPLVVAALDKPETRGNASDYLVATGPAVVPLIMTRLDSSDPAVRLAVADILGKLEVKEAAPRILSQFNSSKDPDRAALLADLANIGWSGSEQVFYKIAIDPLSTPSDRNNAILGLGRVASHSSVSALWDLYTKELGLRAEVIQALQVAGDASLIPSITLDSRLKVASGLSTRAADLVVIQALNVRALVRPAIEASMGRASVVQPLSVVVSNLNPEADGALLDRGIAALESTEVGRHELQSLKKNPRLTGFIQRQELLQSRSPG